MIAVILKLFSCLNANLQHYSSLSRRNFGDLGRLQRSWKLLTGNISVLAIQIEFAKLEQCLCGV